MDEFIGVIRLCSGMYVPEGFLPCNGQQLPINQYPMLFAVIGITYGGDGLPILTCLILTDEHPCMQEQHLVWHPEH
jgi:microcystin-dependent protein